MIEVLCFYLFLLFLLLFLATLIIGFYLIGFYRVYPHVTADFFEVEERFKLLHRESVGHCKWIAVIQGLGPNWTGKTFVVRGEDFDLCPIGVEVRVIPWGKESKRFTRFYDEESRERYNRQDV